MVGQQKSAIASYFRQELSDYIFKVIAKVNGVITLYETTAAASAYVNVVNGELVIEAPPNPGDVVIVFTKEHPRFHPNRGKKFSTSLFYDNKTTGDYEIGFADFDETDLTLINGITFCLKNGTSYARIVSVANQKYYEPIDQDRIAPLGLDFAKGHLMDIQAQLRDVGDIFWYLSGQTSGGPKEVHKFPGLNNQSNVTVASPAMHGVFIGRNNAGVRSKMRVGCMDISNEAQDELTQTPFVFSNDADVTNVPALPGKILYLIEVPFNYKGELNTRDSQWYDASVSSDKKGRIQLFRVPNSTYITKTVGGVPGQPIVDADWTTKLGTSLRFIDNSIGTALGHFITGFNFPTLDTFAGSGIQAGQTIHLEAADPNRVPDIFTHGELVAVVGSAPTAAATMNLESLTMGESI